MERILDREAPDLVVLNGDLVTGENVGLENGTRYVDALVGPLVARGLAWASAYGNHDHGDTWCHKWDTLLPGMTVQGRGLHLCFGQHTGYGSCGNWARGSRQVVITRSRLESRVIDTWIRLETGDVVGNVSPNATYGHDRYPTTPNNKTYCPTCNYTKATPMKRRNSVRRPIKLPVPW